MKIAYADLKQGTNELHLACKNINETLENVSHIKYKIIKSECWVGQASDYYVSKLQTLSNCFDEVFSELQKTALYLDKILENYTVTDKTIVNSSNTVDYNSFRYSRLK